MLCHVRAFLDELLRALMVRHGTGRERGSCSLLRSQWGERKVFIPGPPFFWRRLEFKKSKKVGLERKKAEQVGWLMTCDVFVFFRGLCHTVTMQQGISFFSLKSKNVVWVENSPADETDILSASTTFFHHPLLYTECLTLFLLPSRDNVPSSLQTISSQTQSQTVASPDLWPWSSAQEFYSSVGGNSEDH